jgi:hypothetical protein
LALLLTLSLHINSPALAAAESLAAFPTDKIVETVLFAGDGGNVSPQTERLLTTQPLRNATVVFLGDNAYPRGIPPASDPDAQRAQLVIERQIKSVWGRAARLLFIPGNHDWDDMRRDGWAAMRRANILLQRAGGSLLLPRNACPGPEVLETPRFKIIALDTQWWLHPYAKPDDADSGCKTFTEDQVVKTLEAELKNVPANRSVILVQHHPLYTNGAHSRDTHLQGLRSKRYAHMRDRLLAALNTKPPLLCAAGHDHDLQVLKREGCEYYLVSGSLSNTRDLAEKNTADFGAARLGLIRLDVLNDGRTALRVLAADPSRAEGQELYREWVR